jgi:putative flippase GtrA
MTTLAREAIGYTVASLCALAVDMTILWILVHFLSWRVLPAATLSFLAGAVVAYELSIRIAFRQHRLRDRRTERVGFIALGTVGLGINAVVIAVAVKYAGVQFMLAKGMAAGFTFAWNFVARRQLLFVRCAPAS